MKNSRKVFVSAGVVAAGVVALLTYVHAGPKGQNPIHPNCQTAATVTLDNGIVVNSTGTMQMTVTGNSAADDPIHSQTLQPAGFNATGNDPVLGAVTWTLDKNRTAQPTVISGNVAGQDFPATCDIYFYVLGTFSKQPGITYQSKEPIHMQSTNLQTFSPHVNERYQLANPVAFEDARKPGQTAFTVVQLTSVLN